jgi:uncharacterized protein YfbU (UPF0304 family)
MELSKQERALLASQYRILERLAPGEGFGAAAEIIERGFTPLYSEIESQVDESGLSEDECRLVLDVLELYRDIEAYKGSNPGDRQVAQHPWAGFRGFDGAREAEYLGLARFLLQDRFAESARHAAGTDNFDSHAPTLSKYRHMIAIRKAQGAGDMLSKEAILQILGPGNSASAEARPAESARSGGLASKLGAAAVKVFDFLTGGGQPIPVPASKPEGAAPAPKPAAASEPSPEPATSAPESAPVPAASPKDEAKPAPKASAPRSGAKSATPAPKPAPAARPSAKPKAPSPARTAVKAETKEPVANASPAKAATVEPKASKPAKPAAKPKTASPASRSKSKPS